MLESCIHLPFNWDDAVQAAKLNIDKSKRDKMDRVALKDDDKIVAQALVKEAQWIVTEDDKIDRIFEPLRTACKTRLRTINIAQGFDLSHFNPDGQIQIDFDSQVKSDTSNE